MSSLATDLSCLCEIVFFFFFFFLPLTGGSEPGGLYPGGLCPPIEACWVYLCLWCAGCCFQVYRACITRREQAIIICRLSWSLPHQASRGTRPIHVWYERPLFTTAIKCVDVKTSCPTHVPVERVLAGRTCMDPTTRHDEYCHFTISLSLMLVAGYNLIFSVNPSDDIQFT